MNQKQLVAALFPGGAPQNYKNHALILPSDVVQWMIKSQDNAGATKHRVAPVPTTDGRYLISADIIPELESGGIFMPGLMRFKAPVNEVEVVAWADGVALLPKVDMNDEEIL